MLCCAAGLIRRCCWDCCLRLRLAGIADYDCDETDILELLLLFAKKDEIGILILQRLPFTRTIRLRLLGQLLFTRENERDILQQLGLETDILEELELLKKD